MREDLKKRVENLGSLINMTIPDKPVVGSNAQGVVHEMGIDMSVDWKGWVDDSIMDAKPLNRSTAFADAVERLRDQNSAEMNIGEFREVAEQIQASDILFGRTVDQGSESRSR